MSFILHTIAADGVVDIRRTAHVPALPKCEYRLINQRTQLSYASPGFMSAWKALTLPSLKEQS